MSVGSLETDRGPVYFMPALEIICCMFIGVPVMSRSVSVVNTDHRRLVAPVCIVIFAVFFSLQFIKPPLCVILQEFDHFPWHVKENPEDTIARHFNSDNNWDDHEQQTDHQNCD